MKPIATFPTLDDAESALDWIGLDFAESAGAFEGELADDDRELLQAAIEDPETPPPVASLAQALLARWEAEPGSSLSYAVAWDG